MRNVRDGLYVRAARRLDEICCISCGSSAVPFERADCGSQIARLDKFMMVRQQSDWDLRTIMTPVQRSGKQNSVSYEGEKVKQKDDTRDLLKEQLLIHMSME